MYWLNAIPVLPNSHLALIATSSKNMYELWHNRIGHPGIEVLRKLNTSVKGVKNFAIPNKTHICRGCTLGKMPQKVHPKSTKRATHVLQLVHGDLKEFPILSYHKLITHHGVYRKQRKRLETYYANGNQGE